MTLPRFFRSDAAVVVVAIGALIAVGLVLIVPGVFFSQWSQDLFIPMEGVLHLRAGQWPHRDFMTPVGSGWYWINALPSYLLPITARTMIEANLIVALVAAGLTLLIALPRLPRWLAGLAAFAIGMLALSPRQIGESYAHVSNNASYNRHSWALIAVVALITLLPGPDRRHDRRDAVITAALITALFYIKVTYAVAALGFVVLALITVRGLAGWRFGALTGALALGAIAAIGLLTGDLPGYFADMHTAVVVLPDATRHDAARFLLRQGLPGLAFAGMLGLLAAARPDLLIDWRNGGVWAGWLTAFAGLAISLQNHPEPENPLLPIALLLAWFGTRARMAGPFRFPGLLGLVVVIGFAAPMAADMAALRHSLTAPVETGPATRWLARTHVPDMRIGTRYTAAIIPDNVPIPITDVQIFRSWDDAVQLLQPHLGNRHDAVVLPFTWSNPVPLLLDQPPVRHEVAWWDPTRTFNAAHRPDPHALLDPVDYVLIPHDFLPLDTPAIMWSIYGDTVQRDFVPVGHRGFWDLWARKDCKVRALC